MSEQHNNYGRLVSTHPTSPAAMQRAAIVTVLSFVFFLLMLLVFYVRQNIGYFGLSTAFLIVYVFTLIGWIMQRRNVVRIYENGLEYKKFGTSWDEVRSVNAGGEGIEIAKDKREKVLIPRSVHAYETVVQAIRRGVEQAS